MTISQTGGEGGGRKKGKMSSEFRAVFYRIMGKINDKFVVNSIKSSRYSST
jgi:hypothetical protein